MFIRTLKLMIFSVSISGLLALPAFAESERFLIKCGDDCDQIAESVEALGGTVTHRYKYNDMIAVTTDDSKRGELLKIAGVIRVIDDRLNAVADNDDSTPEAGPSPMSGGVSSGDGMTPPNDTTLLRANNLSNLIANGYRGDGQVVAILDSGVAQDSPIFTRMGCDNSDRTVLGGESFIAWSPFPNEPSATASPITSRGGHGTAMASFLASNGYEIYDSDDPFAQVMILHTPENVMELPQKGKTKGKTAIWFRGAAPCAHIYSLKFLASDGFGYLSDALAALERVIALKENYLNGVSTVPVGGNGTPEDPHVYDALNIVAVNMSFGFESRYAGNTPFEPLIQRLLELGVVSAASAGNEGVTAGSGSMPGVGNAEITVGGYAPAEFERRRWDFDFEFGLGFIIRPIDNILMHRNSSRGPSPDGKISIDVITPDEYLAIPYNPFGVRFIRGTSEAAPQVAGAVAVLKEAMPQASAMQIRSAIIAGANPHLLDDNPLPIDQGAGAMDVEAAFAALQNGAHVPLEQGTESATVSGNYNSIGYKVINLGDGSHSEHLNLPPGETRHFFIRAEPGVEAFRVKFANVTGSELPHNEFLSRFTMKVMDSRTSGNTFQQWFVDRDRTITPGILGEGVVRIAIRGYYRNEEPISADIEISQDRGDVPEPTIKDAVAQGGENVHFFTVQPGTETLSFKMDWKNNWGAYPTDDLRLTVESPSNKKYASHRSYIPFTIPTFPWSTPVDPEVGVWKLTVYGLTVWGVHGGDESNYDIWVNVDGETLPPLK